MESKNFKVARLHDRSRKKHSTEAKSGFAGSSDDRATEQLRLAQQALAQIRESVIITDTQIEEPGPAIVYVNRAFTLMTGYRADEIIGKNPGLLQGPKTTRLTLEGWRAQLGKGEPCEGEDIHYRKDGSEFHTDSYIEPLRDETGRARYFIAVQRDVTQRRLLDKQLLQTERLETMGRLARNIGHDLDNVFAPILIGTDSLQRKTSDPAASLVLTLLEESARRGVALVQQILSLAKGTNGNGQTLARDGAGRSILIVTGETAISELLRETLANTGYHVVTAASSAEVRDRLNGIAPDVALAGLMVPDESNGSIVRELHSRHPQLPVIVISDLSSDEIKQLAPAACAVLRKPFTLENLLVAVHQALAPISR